MKVSRILGVCCFGLLGLVAAACYDQAKEEPPKKPKFDPLIKYELGPPSFFSDGERVVTQGLQHLAVWNIKTGKIVRTLDDSAGEYCLAVSPNGKRILAGSSAGTIALWDTGSGKRIFLDNPNQDWIFNCAFSADGQMAMTGGGRNSPIIWDAREDKFKIIAVCQGHSAGGGSIAFSKDSNLALSAGSEVILWEVPSGKLLKKLEHKGGGKIGFSSDGKSFYCRGWHSQIWEMQTFKVTKRLTLPEKPVPIDLPFRYSPDSHLMVWGDSKNDNALWGTETNKVVRKLENPGIDFKKDHGFNGFDFSPDGKTLVATFDATFYLWNVETGKLARTLKVNRPD